MSAAGHPTYLVELDDVNNGGTWPHNITAYARMRDGYSITSRGPGAEQSAAQAVTLSLGLDNTDGRFTLGSTSGGYGAVNVDRRIRFTITPSGGAASKRFTGYVQNWPVEWPTGGQTFSVVRITATDQIQRWSRRRLRSIIEEEILLDGPLWLYTMSEPAGATGAVDSSGNGAPQLDLLGPPLPVFGTATGPGTDGLTAVQFSGSSNSLMLGAGKGNPKWIEAAFLCSAAPSSDAVIIYAGAGTYSIEITVDNTTGVIRSRAWSQGLGTFVTVTGPNVADSATHHAAAYVDTAGGTFAFYFDGVLMGSGAWSDGTPPAPYPTRVAVGQSFPGVVAHAAGGTTLSSTAAARFAAHSTAVANGFAFETSAQRAARVATYEGSITGTVLDTGLTSLPFVDISGRTVTDVIQQAADAEVGSAYVDGQGRLVFHNRQRAQLRTTPDLVVPIDSDMIDPGTQVVADAAQTVNYATGVRAGVDDAVTQYVGNAANERIHGRYEPNSGEYLVATDQEVLDRLNWVLTTHAEPTGRIPDLTFDLLSADASVQAAVMALDVDSRVQLTGMPSQSPTGPTADLTVLGYSESGNDAEWKWTANTYSWPVYVQAWILGDNTYGVLGTSTRLGI